MRRAAWLIVIGACGGNGVHHLGDAPPGGDGEARVDASRDAGSGSGSGSGSGTIDAGCVPTADPTEICDGLDNDCDGFVDNRDVGSDGIYDCQRMLFLGSQGAHAASNFAAWANGNGSTVTRVTDGGVTVDATLLADYDVVLLDDLPRAYSADEATALATWVAAGGGVMALSGYTGGAGDYDDPNSLVSGMGVQFGTSLLSGPVTEFAPAHPLTTGLTSVTFSGGFPVTATDASATTVGSIGGTPVAVALSVGRGRLYLWGDEWVTFDSEWQGSPEIQEFWVDAFGWLGHYR